MELANKIQDAFEYVTADSDLKESAREFLAVQRRKKSPVFLHQPIYRILAAACMLFVLLCGAGGYAGYSWLFAPVSYISIDVNPSVELALNRLDRVISVSAYNKQGEELLAGLSLRGKKYTTAIDLIAESRILRKYLAADEELVLTVAADSSREEALKEGVEKSCRHIGHGSRSVSVDLDVVSQAHGHGLSVGKYSAWLQLSQYDDSVTVEECRDMSMTEIHCRIIEHEHSSGHGGNTSEQDSGEDGEEYGNEDSGNGETHGTGDSGNDGETHETGDSGNDGETHGTEDSGNDETHGTEDVEDGNGHGTQAHGHQHKRNHGNHE